MSRGHLVSVDEIEENRDQIVREIIRDHLYEFFAKDVVSGKFIWNPETDMFVVREKATEREFDEAVKATARLMKHLDQSPTTA